MHLIIQMQETGVGFNYDPHIQAGSPPSPQWLSVANEQQWEAKAAHTQPEGEEVYIMRRSCASSESGWDREAKRH